MVRLGSGVTAQIEIAVYGDLIGDLDQRKVSITYRVFES